MERTEELTRLYHLLPHPEGGSFAEVYTSSAAVYGRALAGSIYFLLNGEEISHLHVIDCEEVWYYHEGTGLTLTLIAPDGTVTRETLGADAARGERFMLTVPAGTAFASENADKRGYTFVSCMTAPRFSYDGFRLLTRAELERLCPREAGSLGYLIAE